MAGENNPIYITTRSQPYWSNRLYSNIGKLFQIDAANKERLDDIQTRKDVNAEIQRIREQLASTTDPEQKQQLQDKLDKLISQRQELENKRYAAQANFYNALGNIASSAWDKGRAHDQSSAYLNEQAVQHQTEAAEYQRAQQANMQIANRDTRQEAERTAASEGAFKAQQAAAHLSADAGSGAAALAAAKAATDVTPDYARYEQRSDERRDTALDNAQSRYTSQQFGIQERKAAASEDYQSQQEDRYNNQVQSLSAGNSPYVVPADNITNNQEETSNNNPGTEVTDDQGGQSQNNNQGTGGQGTGFSAKNYVGWKYTIGNEVHTAADGDQIEQDESGNPVVMINGASYVLRKPEDFNTNTTQTKPESAQIQPNMQTNTPEAIANKIKARARDMWAKGNTDVQSIINAIENSNDNYINNIPKDINVAALVNEAIGNETGNISQ